MANHKWQFIPRFRRNAFGWKSDLPIKRIKEALAEIRQVARKESVVAAEGAISFLEKLSPSLEQVDSSSGAIGSAVNKAIEALVPIIAKADVESQVRQIWLERLWQTLQDDERPYIELLGDYWGDLCVTQDMASQWAEEFIPMVEFSWRQKASAYGYFKGTSACLASLYSAGRHTDILTLIDKAPFKWWHDRRWGVKALSAMGHRAQALRYAEESRGRHNPGGQIAQACEAILLSSGLADAAYQRYAIEANQCTTHLATFRAIAKKYPHKPKAEILHDLVASTPGAEGKWFAAAKDAGLFDVAKNLAASSPTDPRTLTRAARDYTEKQPDFALAAGLAALHWISHGYGYEISSIDVIDAYNVTMQAANVANVPAEEVKARIMDMTKSLKAPFLQNILKHHLSS